MNLWIFNHYAVTPDLPGGTRHFDFGRELVKKGHDVTIFASGFHHFQHRRLKLLPGESWSIEDIDYLKFIWIKTFPYRRNDWRRVLNMISYMLRAWWLGRKLPRLNAAIKEPDVIIGSSVHLLAVFSAYWLAKYYKVRFVMEVRDLWPQTIIDMSKMNERHPVVTLLNTLEKFLYKRAEKIITLSPLTEAHLDSLGVMRSKICLVPNGVDISRYKDAHGPKLDNRDFVAMYLGAHGAVHNLDIILDAARFVRNKGYKSIRFILIGDGPAKPQLMARKELLKLHNVEFFDPVSKFEAPGTLGQADVLILAENKVLYGSSNKLFDYMASGKPIIFSTFAEHNTVKDARCGLTVSPRDPQALAEAVIRLYQMPIEDREELGHRGRKYVERHHAIPVLAERVVHCIEGTLR